MFVDGFRSETDFFGTPIAYTFAKEMAVTGAATYGAAVGVDAALQHHFFHAPFLDPRSAGATLSLNPIIKAANVTWNRRSENDEDYVMTQFFQNWLGGSGPIPVSVVRFNRIFSKGEAPDVYGDDNLRLARYFMSVPAYSATHDQ